MTAANVTEALADVVCAFISAACIYYVTGLIGFRSSDIRWAARARWTGSSRSSRERWRRDLHRCNQV